MNNIKLTIHTPGDKKVVGVAFQSLNAATPYVILYRYSVNDIANYAELQANGKLRHMEKRSYINGGIQLPRTEKLILLVKGNSDASKLTIGGTVYELEGGSKLFEIDMFDFGLRIDEGGEVKLKCDKPISVAFIARY